MPTFTAQLERIVFRYGTRAIALGYLFYGLALCVAGPDRFLAPGLSGARLIPGWPYTWGITLFIASASAVYGLVSHRRIVTAYSLLATSLWLAFMGSLGLVAIASDTRAGVGAFFANFVPAIAIAIRSIAYFVRDPEEGRAHAKPS